MSLLKRMKKVDKESIKWKVLYGDVRNPESDIAFSSRYTRFGFEIEELKVGDFGSRDAEDGSEVYEVMNIKGDKAYIKPIGKTKYNDILKNHRERKDNQIILDPKGSAINVILNGEKLK